MSGPKCGQITSTQIGALRRRCQGVERWLQSLPELPSMAQLNAELDAARAEAQELRRNPIADSVAMLDIADRHRADLTLLLKQHGDVIASAESARTQLRGALASARARLDAGGATTLVAAAQNDVETATTRAQLSHRLCEAETKKVAVLRRELALIQEKLRGPAPQVAPTPAPSAPSRPAPPREDPELEMKNIRRKALLDEAERRLGQLSAAVASDKASSTGWLKGSGTWSQFEKLLATARGAAKEGDAEAAEEAVSQAEVLRDRILQEAATNREAADRNQRVANAIMQALCDRHYNTPNFGNLQGSDPLSGIQIRADVPNRDGRGNIRIDIQLDGTTVFEVENVPEGEERVCRDVIAGVGEALVTSGLELKMTDWGRATGAGAAAVELPTAGPGLMREPEAERMRRP